MPYGARSHPGDPLKKCRCHPLANWFKKLFGTEPKASRLTLFVCGLANVFEPAGLMLTRRDGSRPQIHASRILHPTTSITCSLLGSMTLTSASLHTKVVMRMLDNGVRNLM